MLCRKAAPASTCDIVLFDFDGPSICEGLPIESANDVEDVPDCPPPLGFAKSVDDAPLLLLLDDWSWEGDVGVGSPLRSMLSVVVGLIDIGLSLVPDEVPDDEDVDFPEEGL